MPFANEIFVKSYLLLSLLLNSESPTHFQTRLSSHWFERLSRSHSAKLHKNRSTKPDLERASGLELAINTSNFKNLWDTGGRRGSIFFDNSSRTFGRETNDRIENSRRNNESQRNPNISLQATGHTEKW